MEKVGMGGPLLAGVGRLTCEGAKIQLVSPGATASILQDGRAVFNVGGNEYRIVTWINYPYRVVYIRFIGTHRQYDDIDAQTI
jgi:mRNA interferase HigB